MDVIFEEIIQKRRGLTVIFNLIKDGKSIEKFELNANHNYRMVIDVTNPEEFEKLKASIVTKEMLRRGNEQHI